MQPLSPQARMALAFLMGGIYIGFIVGVAIGSVVAVLVTLAIV